MIRTIEDRIQNLDIRKAVWEVMSQCSDSSMYMMRHVCKVCTLTYVGYCKAGVLCPSCFGSTNYYVEELGYFQ